MSNEKDNDHSFYNSVENQFGAELLSKQLSNKNKTSLFSELDQAYSYHREEIVRAQGHCFQIYIAIAAGIAASIGFGLKQNGGFAGIFGHFALPTIIFAGFMAVRERKLLIETSDISLPFQLLNNHL